MMIPKSLVLALVVSAFVLGCGGAQGLRSTKVPGPMPAEGNFDGVWYSDFGRLEITCESDKCTGLFEDDRRHGKLEGEVDGNLLRFEWESADVTLKGKARIFKGQGVFEYVVRTEGNHQVHALSGDWGYDGSDAGNIWNATKAQRKTKKKLKPYTGEAAAMDDGAGPPPNSAGFEDADQADEPGMSEAPSGEESGADEEEDKSSNLDGIF